MKLAFVFLVVFLSVFFTWTNGFQHASAVAANAIGSHSLSKKQVVLIVFVCELLGTLFGGSAVADAVRSLSKWPYDASVLPVLCSALLAAIVWNYLARHVKMPASSTHALLGGMIGALVAGAGSTEYLEFGQFDILHPTGVIGAVVSLFLSPMLGVVVGYILFNLVLLLCLRASNKIDHAFKHLQFYTTALLAFGDGQNDTQKTMGLIVLALSSAGYLSGSDIPLWVRALIGLAMGLGAFFISPGLLDELATHVYKLSKVHAFVSELSGAAVLVSNSLVGGPVSSSQVIAASILGGAIPQRIKGVHWMVVKNVLLSWLVTIPANALLAAIAHAVFFRWFSNALG